MKGPKDQLKIFGGSFSKKDKEDFSLESGASIITMAIAIPFRTGFEKRLEGILSYKN